MLNDYLMKDAAFLDKVDSNTLHEADVWAGYISGEGATHIWSDNDWRRVAAFPKLPIPVATPGKSGTYAGYQCLIAIHKLGIPRGTAVSPDMELFFTEPNWDMEGATQWLYEFYAVMHHFDFWVWKYGSTSYLFDLPLVDGSWVATDSKVKEQYHHSGVHATQFLFDDNGTDDSVIHRHAVHTRLAADWGVNHVVGSI